MFPEHTANYKMTYVLFFNPQNVLVLMDAILRYKEKHFLKSQTHICHMPHVTKKHKEVL